MSRNTKNNKKLLPIDKALLLLVNKCAGFSTNERESSGLCWKRSRASQFFRLHEDYENHPNSFKYQFAQPAARDQAP